MYCPSTQLRYDSSSTTDSYAKLQVCLCLKLSLLKIGSVLRFDSRMRKSIVKIGLEVVVLETICWRLGGD